ncbi:MAG: triose-phosphate isomerase [Saprospiraceae bacterium]|nr:triose-phosphate isomerase [Saprospiraceae bacterium]
MERSRIVAANWKMNVLPSEAMTLAGQVAQALPIKNVEVIICPPFTHLFSLMSLQSESLKIGAQNCNENPFGAHTGDISAQMLKDLGCRYVIIGHSERRARQSTENARISAKIHAALQAGLKPIYCCGEGLPIREKEAHIEFVKDQLETDLTTLQTEHIEEIVIAYEPVWAIGTGKNASPEQAQEMHASIRKWLSDRFGSVLGTQTRILYGGSVKAVNALALAKQNDIDGFLVGGASLNVDEFIKIVHSVSESAND